jgi:hypothetical protein
MKSVLTSEMLEIIAWIKETETMIKMWEARLPDPAAKLNILQFEEQKQNFVKQLLAELLRSPHNISDIEPFLLKATSYLKKFDKNGGLSKDLQLNLQEVERLMAV